MGHSSWAMTKLPTVLCLSLAASLPAQAAKDQPDLAPAAVVLEFAGPAALRSQFRSTNLGSLLATKQVVDLWAVVMQPARQLVASLGKEVPSRFDALCGLLTEYRGRARIVFDLAAAELDRLPTVSATLVVEPDGRTDLEAVAKSIRAVLAAVPVPTVAIEAGQRQLRLSMFGPQLGLAWPEVVDGCLVFAVSADIAGFVAAGFPAASATTRLPPHLHQSALALRVDFERVLPVLAEVMTEWPFDESGQFLTALGLDSLRDLSFALRPAGPRVLAEVSVGFRAGPRGVFGALFPVVCEVPDVDSLAPAGENWQSGHFDLAKLFRSVYAAARTTPYDLDLEAVVNESMGVRLVEDLLAHMDSGYLELGSLMGYVDDSDCELSPPGEPELCLAIALKDPSAFARGWQTCAKHIQIWDEDPELVEGIELHRCGLFGFRSMRMGWAIVGHRFVVCYGSDRSVAWAKDLVARSLARPESASRVLSAEWQRLQRYAPPGHNGSGELDLIGLLRDTRWEILEQFAGPETEGLTESVLRELLPLMRRFELARGVTMSGYAADRWCYRVLW